MPKNSEKKPRALSAYNFFMKDKRKEILEEKPDTDNKEIMRIVSKMWKEVSEDEKEKYNQLAAEDKKRVAELRKDEPASSRKTRPKKKKESESDDDESDD